MVWRQSTVRRDGTLGIGRSALHPSSISCTVGPAAHVGLGLDLGIQSVEPLRDAPRDVRRESSFRVGAMIGSSCVKFLRALWLPELGRNDTVEAAIHSVQERLARPRIDVSTGPGIIHRRAGYSGTSERTCNPGKTPGPRYSGERSSDARSADILACQPAAGGKEARRAASPRLPHRACTSSYPATLPGAAGEWGGRMHGTG